MKFKEIGAPANSLIYDCASFQELAFAVTKSKKAIYSFPYGLEGGVIEILKPSGRVATRRSGKRNTVYTPYDRYETVKTNPSPPVMASGARLSRISTIAADEPKKKKRKLSTLARLLGTKSNPARSPLRRTATKKRIKRVKKKPPAKRTKRARRNPVTVLHPYVIRALRRKGGAIENLYWDGEKFVSDKRQSLHFDSAKEAFDFAQTIVKRLPYSIHSLRCLKARDA